MILGSILAAARCARSLKRGNYLKGLVPVNFAMIRGDQHPPIVLYNGDSLRAAKWGTAGFEEADL